MPSGEGIAFPNIQDKGENSLKKKSRRKWVGILLCTASMVLLLQWLYIGYRYSFGPFHTLGNLRLAGLAGNAERYRMQYVEERKDSPYRGKKILFLGSSVTYGAGSLEEGIPEYFAARFGAEVTKEAVSGTTLTDDSRTSYVHRLQTKVDPSTPYSLVVIQLSTNDASRKKPLGEIAESRNREDFDKRTITGAIETCIAYAEETWNCPVVFYTGSRYDSSEYGAMVERLKQLQKKWDIDVLDLWSDEAFNNISDAERKLYMTDDIHPTRAGYREWWCPEMERQLWNNRK